MNRDEILASVLFDSYPDSDCLPIERPQPAETIATFCDWAKGYDFGDSLFSFLLKELSGCDKTEAIERLCFAIRDLESVLQGIEEL